VSRNDVILGVVTAVLVGFSLVVALVIPRRNPGFPGPQLRFFLVLSALLVVGMLGAVEVLGESHDFGEAHGETGDTTEVTPTATGEAPTTTTGETGEQPQGDPEAGREVFTSAANPACGTCHTLQAAGTSQTLGPDLDETLADKDAAYIRQSILEPDAEVTPGFSDALMPEDYGETLTEQQINDLVAFLFDATHG
jgi:mono/diheme cytochrome c family protein